jgi:(5-formylfuran-3-yl)methyl phosphate synthase
MNTTPRLLVSVKDRQEAAEAVAAEIDWLDLKNPLHGPLGPVDECTARDIADWLPSNIPLSAAGGELLQWLAAEDGNPWTGPAGIGWIKLGLSGCGALPNWPDLWRQANKTIQNAGKQLVAVIYADWRQANAPAPAEILGHVSQGRFQFLLVDTFEKTGGTVLDHLPPDKLGSILRKVQQMSIHTVVAGGLSVRNLSRLTSLPIDLLAIRGAACTAGRNSPVKRQCIDHFKQMVAQYEWRADPKM